MPPSDSSLKELIVVPRDKSKSIEQTRQVLQKAISETFPEMRLLNVNPETGVAKVEVPEHKVEHVKSMLDHNFIVEFNAPLDLY